MSRIILADSHAHISKQYFPDIPKLLKEAKEKGLEYVASMGTGFEDNQECTELKKAFHSSEIFKDFYKIGIGIHPEEVIKCGKFFQHELSRVEAQIRENIDFIDYIGEIGVDYTYPDANEYLMEQLTVFEYLCNIAVEFDKPVSIHIRDKFDDALSILERVYKDKKLTDTGSVHCFTGTVNDAKRIINLGLRLGIGGIITYKKSENLRDVIRQVVQEYPNKSLDELFTLETDSPYLSPEPERGKTNSPSNIVIIRDFLLQTVSN